MVYAVVGIHPTAVDEAADGDDASLREIAEHPRVAAIGETGLDYHRLPADPEEASGVRVRQAASFRQQLDLGAALGLNVVIHQRDAWEDTLAILRAYTGRVCGGCSIASAARPRKPARCWRSDTSFRSPGS